VVARDRAGRCGPDPILSGLDRSDFDALWLFGVDVGDGLDQRDCAGIARFWRRGGGLLLTRDNLDLSRSLYRLGGVGMAHCGADEVDGASLGCECIDDGAPVTAGVPLRAPSETGFREIEPIAPVHATLRQSVVEGSVLRYLPAGGDEAELALSAWHWRNVTHRDCSVELDAALFIDDPIGALPSDTLAQRMAAATAFAEALNCITHPDDVRFVARPLEVVIASTDRPEGIYPGDDSDVLAIDLMAEMSSPQMIARMIREEYDGDPEVIWRSQDGYFPQKKLWHRLERLDAVRAMFDPKLRQVAVPDVSDIRRILKAGHGSLKPERDPRP
jgi:hypothetical protein